MSYPGTNYPPLSPESQNVENIPSYQRRASAMLPSRLNVYERATRSEIMYEGDPYQGSRQIGLHNAATISLARDPKYYLRTNEEGNREGEREMVWDRTQNGYFSKYHDKVKETSSDAAERSDGEQTQETSHKGFPDSPTIHKPRKQQKVIFQDRETDPTEMPKDLRRSRKNGFHRTESLSGKTPRKDFDTLQQNGSRDTTRNQNESMIRYNSRASPSSPF